MTRTTRPHTASRQDGFVAIFVTIIIMMVLTLVVVGFTGLVRQEQRRALDRQLNTQAFYAAEVGVNDAINAIKNGTIVDNSTSCETPATLGSTSIDTTLKVDYTCVLVTTKVNDIKKDNVPLEGRAQSFIMPLTPDVASPPMQRLVVEWDSPTASVLPTAAMAGANLLPGNPRLPTTGAWGANTIGGLRIDLTPTTPALLDRVNQVNQTQTFYVLPTSDSGGFSGIPVTPTKGQIIIADCVTVAADGHRCNTTINVVPGGLASYIIRVSSLYAPTKLWLRPTTNAGLAVTLTNAQAIIDSTGKANDVFRRIQERVPLASEFANYESANFVVESGDSICKRLSIYPGMATSPDLECGTN